MDNTEYKITSYSASDPTEGINSIKTSSSLTDHYYELMFKNIRDAILVTNINRRIIDCNPAFTKIFGYTLKEVYGKTTDLIYKDQESYSKMGAFIKNMPVGAENNKIEIEYKTKNGKIILCEVGAYTLMDEYNNPRAYIGVFRDLTQRNKEKIHLKQTLNERNILLAEIHHRVKNNLAVISSLLELQAMKTPQVENILKVSQNRIKSIAKAHELLYKAKNFALINIHEYLEDLGNINRDTFSSNNMEISLDIRVDEVELSVNQAIPFGLMLNELMTNSFKYAFKGKQKGEISIYIRQHGEVIEMEYRDNGGEIKDLHSFDDFEQQHSLGIELIQVLLTQLEAYDQRLCGDEGFHLCIKFKIKKPVHSSAATFNFI